MSAQLEKQLASLLTILKKLSDDVAPLVERRNELLGLATLSAENKAELKKINTDFEKRAPKQIKTQSDIIALQKSLVELEKKDGRRSRSGTGVDYEMPQSPGTLFSESEIYKAWKDEPQGERNDKTKPVKIRLSIDGFYKRTRWYQKSARTGKRRIHMKAHDQGTAGALVPDFDKPDVVLFNRNQPIHRDFLNILPLPETDTVKIDRELISLIAFTQLVNAAAPTDTTLDVASLAPFSDAVGFNTVIVVLNGGALETRTVQVAGLAPDDPLVPNGPGTLTIDAMVGTADAANEVRSPTFVLTPECAFFPQSEDRFEQITIEVVKLGTHVVSTEEILADAVRLEDIINRRLLAKYSEMESEQVFYGTGGGNTVTGFFNDADIPIVLLSALPAGNTKLDAILFAMVVCSTANYPPTAALISWQDIRDIWQLKGGDDHYIFMQAMVGQFPAMLWMVPLTPTNTIKAGKALVADFESAATLFLREEAEISIGMIDKQYIEDKKTMKIRGRFAFAVEIPQAACIVDFA